MRHQTRDGGWVAVGRVLRAPINPYIPIAGESPATTEEEQERAAGSCSSRRRCRCISGQCAGRQRSKKGSDASSVAASVPPGRDAVKGRSSRGDRVPRALGGNSEVVRHCSSLRRRGPGHLLPPPGLRLRLWPPEAEGCLGSTGRPRRALAEWERVAGLLLLCGAGPGGRRRLVACRPVL